MKKLVIILTILLIFPLISSIEFETKEEFDQGETLVAVISGNFLDQITRDNIFFYRGHVRIPMVYEMGKINDDFYIYAMLTGKEQGNYSVIIQGIRYARGIEIVDEDIVKNFTITENTTDFSLTPGFIITSEDFFLEVQNLQEKRITIQIDTPEAFISENSLELKSGETKRIKFKLNEEVLNLSSAFEEIKLNSENTNYYVPVFVMSDINITEEEKRLNFKFEPHIVDVSIATDSDSKRIVYILNTGASVENIFISVSPLLEPYVTVSPQEINTLEKNSTEKIEIFIASGTEEIIIEGQIFARAENFTSSLILILDFIKDFIPEEPEEEILTTCAQLEGIICEDGERCTGKTASTKDGICCFAPAICEEIPKKQTGKIIGWGVIILVILFLFWFFKKYKKVKPKVDLLKIGRGKK